LEQLCLFVNQQVEQTTTTTTTRTRTRTTRTLSRPTRIKMKGLVLVFLFPSAVWALVNVHSYKLPEEDLFKYHGDHVCDRAIYNTFKERMERHLTYQRFKTTGFAAVPNQRTVICPETVQDLTSPTHSIGYDTVWIVENTASDPVVLSYVDPTDGVEYAAMNTKITPPHHDPDSILKPGSWRAIYSWEGHVFLARQLLQSQGSNEKSLGPVLMQHRIGLTPIGQNAQNLICLSTDPEPLLNGTRAPEFARVPPANFRMCNTIDLGFRNMANCPLHAYWVKPMDGAQVEALADYEEVDDTKPLYEERFEFHLGINPSPQDFTWDWDSKTKFEGTLIGHTFAFRSAEDPSILVQTHTVRPTRIPDCPNLKKKQQVNRVTSIGIAQSVVVPIRPQEFTNATATNSTYAWNLNATHNHRRCLRQAADIRNTAFEAMTSAVLAS
jgi:hypothetical protein